jgi:hypothetical protein
MKLQVNRLLLSAFLACMSLGPLGAQVSSAVSGGTEDDITGLYTYLHEGESVQLNVQHGELTGWVTSYGLLESDRETLVDRFFQKAMLEGQNIYFITKPVHGSWVEFKGKVERGEAKSRVQEGFYLLTGMLTEYSTDADHHVSSRQRQAVFKLQANPNADPAEKKNTT